MERLAPLDAQRVTLDDLPRVELVFALETKPSLRIVADGRDFDRLVDWLRSCRYDVCDVLRSMQRAVEAA